MDFRMFSDAQISFSPQQVVWAEQQFHKQREKRYFIPPLDGGGVPVPVSRLKRDDLQVPSERLVRIFNDELWDQEWYLVSQLQHTSLWYTAIMVVTPSSE
jgi:hypothetical protein